MEQRPACRASRRRTGAEGFSLVEALFAVLLLVVAAGGLVRGIAQASRARQAAAHTGLATRIARGRMEELLAAPFSRGWPWSGYHEAVSPGGSAEVAGAGAAGYFAYFGEDGEPSDRRNARYEVRWRIRELVPPGEGQLASLRLEVVALPVPAGAGPVVRLESIRVANGE